MTSLVMEKAVRDLVEAERELVRRQAEGKPWMIRYGEERVAAAKKKIAHFQFLQTEIEVDALKYAKAHPADPPRYTEPPAREMTDEEAIAAYVPDPELVRECVADYKAHLFGVPKSEGTGGAGDEPPLP